MLFFVDILAYGTGLTVSVVVRGSLPQVFTNWNFPHFYREAYYTSETLILLFIILIVFIWNKLYQSRRPFWEELIVIWKSLLISSLICYLFLFNFQELLPFFSRTTMLLLFVNLMLILPLYRMILKYIWFQTHFGRTPIVILCQEQDLLKSLSITQSFFKDFYFGVEPVGFFLSRYPEKEIIFHQKSLPVYTQKENIPVHTTLFAVENILEHDQSLKTYIFRRYRKVYLIFYKNIIGSSGQYFFSERILVRKLENQLNSYLSQFLKLLMDRIGGVILILLFSPLLLTVALLIKISSPGPVFYQQKRIGEKGIEFKIWKFRSMYINADQKLQTLLLSDPALKKEWDMYFKLKNDPRITSVGKILRKYSIDEFPQLFNVIFGEMSLVGPRPFVQGEIDSSILPAYALVKPGLTGLWQISGRNNIDRLERVEIDLWYIQNWSPTLDLLILLNTPFAVLSGRGAS